MRPNLRWPTNRFAHRPFKELIELDFFKKLIWSEKLQFVFWYQKYSTVKMDSEDLYKLEQLQIEFEKMQNLGDWKVDISNKISRIEYKEDKLNEIKSILANEFFKDFNSDMLEDEEILPKDKIPFLENLLKVTELNPEGSESITLNKELNNSISKTLTLIKELGIWDLLKSRIEENKGTFKDLEKLIAYLFKYSNPDSVGRYFPYMENTTLKDKNTPFTGPAIEVMNNILKECNIEVKGNYTKKDPKNTE